MALSQRYFETTPSHWSAFRIGKRQCLEAEIGRMAFFGVGRRGCRLAVIRTIASCSDRPLDTRRR